MDEADRYRSPRWTLEWMDLAAVTHSYAPYGRHAASCLACHLEQAKRRHDAALAAHLAARPEA